MLLWRMRPTASANEERIECHLIRRDMEYRLTVRSGKAVLIQETHRTPTAAAERAESLRRRAMEGALTPALAASHAGDGDKEQAS